MNSVKKFWGYNMIIVTGGAGLIGSALIWQLNQYGKKNILIVDSLGNSEKWKNLVGIKFADYIDKKKFLEKILAGDYDKDNIETIFHFGACSNTQESDANYLIENNYEYSKILAKFCKTKNIQFIYASSAATYGDGENGYSEKELKLKPLNMYGYSKHLFDLWLIEQKYFKDVKNKIIGIKFFNVFGPNENHKNDMRSMINKAFFQIKETGKISLFKSYKKEFADGDQKRDFVYVKDAVKIVLSLAEKQKKSKKNISGVYNLGSGKTHSWNELANAIFLAMKLKPKIEYVDMPGFLKDKYQYFTQADMKKTFSVVGNYKFYDLKAAVSDYVRNYLAKDLYLESE